MNKKVIDNLGKIQDYAKMNYKNKDVFDKIKNDRALM